MSGGADFWARRKAAVQAEAEAEVAAVEARKVESEKAALEEKTDAEILAELNLPDPESLQLGDDIRGFMGKAVPDRLRRRALRQLWKLNPVLANVDGLVDYGEDFTDSALVVENLQTAYQVGKGMLAHVEEMARQAEEKLALADRDTDDDVATEETAQPPEIAEDPAVECGEPDAPTSSPDTTDEPDTAETQENQSDTRFAAASRRRMRFAFEN